MPEHDEHAYRCVRTQRSGWSSAMLQTRCMHLHVGGTAVSSTRERKLVARILNDRSRWNACSVVRRCANAVTYEYCDVRDVGARWRACSIRMRCFQRRGTIHVRICGCMHTPNATFPKRNRRVLRLGRDYARNWKCAPPRIERLNSVSGRAI